MNIKNFKIALLNKNLPAVGLAKKLGVDRSTISRVMNGWIEPPLELKKKISSILEVEESFIFENPPNPKSQSP